MSIGEINYFTLEMAFSYDKVVVSGVDIKRINSHTIFWF